MYLGKFIKTTQAMTILLFLVTCAIVHGQKRLFKEWTAPSFSEIHIDSDHISKITIRSQKIDQVSVFIRLEGETYENSIVTVASHETTLTLGTDFTPFFKSFNDKLAAHKVLAIEMIVVVPERMALYIRSRLANVVGWGSFSYIKTELESGFVQLDYFEGNATLHSKWGLIEVHAQNSVSGKAESTYGKVTNLLPAEGKYKVEARTSHGSIHLLQTKK